LSAALKAQLAEPKVLHQAIAESLSMAMEV
jgi:hypothetical protein